jgi:hypothetical protein
VAAVEPVDDAVHVVQRQRVQHHVRGAPLPGVAEAAHLGSQAPASGKDQRKQNLRSAPEDSKAETVTY